MIEILNLENVIPVSLLEVLGVGAVRAVMRDVMAGARAEWIRLASTELHTTSSTYIDGIQAVTWIGDDVASITLVGVLPNLIEQGMGRMDMHDTLLGPQVPVGDGGKHERLAGGYYRAIPFRHRVPVRQGNPAHGPAMGQAYAKEWGDELAKAIGKDVYRGAKNLTATVSDPYTGQTKWGERLDTYDLNVPKLKSYHASDPYAGMVRNEKTYQEKTQSSYATFRTISVDGNSRPVGSSPWVRMATPGKNFAQQVSAFVSTRLAPQAFAAYVSALR